MKKLLSAFAIILALLSLTPHARAAGGDNPFPLDYPLPFPWGTIEGLWEVGQRNYHVFYSFQVQNDCDGHQILKVMEIEPGTGRILAEGTGSKPDDSKQAVAGMIGKHGSFMLYVGKFKDTHSVPPRYAYILRVKPFGSDHGSDYRINKVSNTVPYPEPTKNDAVCK